MPVDYRSHARCARAHAGARAGDVMGHRSRGLCSLSQAVKGVVHMTTLAEVRDGTTDGIDLLALRRNKPLCTEVQTQLGRLGLLDPPADGDFGPVTTWAWGQFC